MTTERLVKILMDYHCTFTRDDSMEGDIGLPLVDKLTPPGSADISQGIQEIELLADYILGEMEDDGS